MKPLRTCIGVSSGELCRYGVFWDSLIHMRGVTHQNVLCHRSANIARNRNAISERAIQLGFQAILYVDDDQVFPPDTLEKLMAHDLDIVSGLYLRRQLPWSAHIYNEFLPGEGWKSHDLKKGEGGLIECQSVGAGCLLVKVDVLRKMAQPWWTLGQFDKVDWCDDHDFCTRARGTGFKIHCDLEARVGHSLNGAIWPQREPDGEWKSFLVQGNEAIAIWPAAMNKPEGA